MLVGYIIECSKRMSDLFADLLAYAEIGAFREESVETVDLNVVVEKVRQNVKMTIEESGASIVSAGLPILSAAHECDCLQLFQNLIENVMNYRSELTPSIHISAHRTLKCARGETIRPSRNPAIGRCASS